MLDVGSNTVHLLLVDAHRGAHPWPAYQEKSVLRLAERLNPHGGISPEVADDLVAAVASARKAAHDNGAVEMLGFATSAVRDAKNSSQVLARVYEETGVRLEVLPGNEEARLTFLAVRRWFGWSAGRLLVLDIGGGSLEIAAGIDEDPEVATSLPLGAGRLTRDRLFGDPPPTEDVEALAAYAARQLSGVNIKGSWDSAAATSKTFRTLARLAGAAPSGEGVWTPRRLTRRGLHQVLGFIRHMSSDGLKEIDGVSAARAHQLLAGAVVAEAAMQHFGIDELAVCPWALREGVILRRLDLLAEA